MIKSINIHLAVLLLLLLIPVNNLFAFELLWYGQSAVKITTDKGKVILIDPFISQNPKTPEPLKDLTKIGQIDLILVTHGHGDHVGDTVAIAKASGAKVAMNADMGRTFVEQGWLPADQVIRFNKSGTVTPLGPELPITMVRAEHSSAVSHTDPKTGEKLLLEGGEPAGYIIRLEDGYTIYHAGDTGVFMDMQQIAERYHPDLELLPIGGHFTMGPEDAAWAIKHYLKSKRVMPIHYGTFGLLKGTPEELIAALGKNGTDVVVMKPGESRKFSK